MANHCTSCATRTPWINRLVVHAKKCQKICCAVECENNKYNNSKQNLWMSGTHTHTHKMKWIEQQPIQNIEIQRDWKSERENETNERMKNDKINTNSKRYTQWNICRCGDWMCFVRFWVDLVCRCVFFSPLFNFCRVIDDHRQHHTANSHKWGKKHTDQPCSPQWSLRESTENELTCYNSTEWEWVSEATD